MLQYISCHRIGVSSRYVGKHVYYIIYMSYRTSWGPVRIVIEDDMEMDLGRMDV